MHDGKYKSSLFHVPVSDEIMSGNSRLLIVANLNLEYLPFSSAGKLLGYDIFYLYMPTKLSIQPWFKRIQRFLSARKYADKQSTYHEKIQAHLKAVEHQSDCFYTKRLCQPGSVAEPNRTWPFSGVV